MLWARSVSGGEPVQKKLWKSSVFAALTALSRYTIRFGIAAVLHIDFFLLDFMFILQNLFAIVWFSELVIRSIIIIFIISNGQIEIHFIFSSFLRTCFFAPHRPTLFYCYYCRCCRHHGSSCADGRLGSVFKIFPFRFSFLLCAVSVGGPSPLRAQCYVVSSEL